MRLLPASLLAILVVAPTVPAQRPDLSGTWVFARDQAPATLPAAPSAVLGGRFALDVGSSAVTVTQLSGESSITATIPLDGTRARLMVPGRLCEGERTVEQTAQWDGNGLVLSIVASQPAGGGPPVPSGIRRILRLEAPDRLVVEGTMMQQGQARQVGAVYLRSTEPMPPARPAPPVTPFAATIDKVAWIGTIWRGTTGTLTTEERWTPPASGGMMATARTLRGAALASFEFLCIAERGNSLAYIAMPDARTPATYFHLTALTDSSATFENPAHDYPKMIRYRLMADGGLETTIAAENGQRARSVVLKPEATPR
jgi:hypothetical protein